jgi:hypothetical protein
MPRRPKFERTTTPELEMIEKGPASSKGLVERQSSSDLSASSGSSMSTNDDLGDNSESLAFIGEKPKAPLVVKKNRTRQFTEKDVDKYMASRVMTPLQERMNAITVMPGAFYCFLFLLSGAWLDKSLVAEARDEMLNGNDMLPDASGCISSTWIPHLHALPPLPVIAGALGIMIHAPFSFIYHWNYAHRLPPGLARTTHWSRRLDQAMLHVCSACMAYATSGRWDFFAANLLFNMDCIYRHFVTRVRPRRNQIRLAISVIAYTIPILRRGDMRLFGELWLGLGISSYFFLMYPIGGWSHSAFHLLIAVVPPLLLTSAIELPASQGQLKVAAQCAAIAHQNLYP